MQSLVYAGFGRLVLLDDTKSPLGADLHGNVVTAIGWAISNTSGEPRRHQVVTVRLAAQ
jgi:hypothetical protein